MGFAILLAISIWTKIFSPCPRSRLRIWSRETGLAVPFLASLFILRTRAESGAYLRDPLSATASIFTRALHSTLFLSVQRVMVSKNHGFKWFVVMVFTLPRLKMDGSGEPRFAAVRFTVPG